MLSVAQMVSEQFFGGGILSKKDDADDDKPKSWKVSITWQWRHWIQLTCWMSYIMKESCSQAYACFMYMCALHLFVADFWRVGTLRVSGADVHVHVDVVHVHVLSECCTTSVLHSLNTCLKEISNMYNWSCSSIWCINTQRYHARNTAACDVIMWRHYMTYATALL